MWAELILLSATVRADLKCSPCVPYCYSFSLRVFLPQIQMFEIITNEVPTFIIDISVQVIRMLSM
jgi:hypothetical protein